MSDPWDYDLGGLDYAPDGIAEMAEEAWVRGDITDQEFDEGHYAPNDRWDLSDAPEAREDITCERCGRTTTDPDRWDPEYGTGRIFCDACWPQRDNPVLPRRDGWNLPEDECPAGGPHTPTNASSHPDRMTDPYWHCDECGASLPTPEWREP